jgi:isoamylase
VVQVDVKDVQVRVVAPDVSRLDVVAGDRVIAAERADDGAWRATWPAADGEQYWLRADGLEPLLDPSARRVTRRGDQFVCVVEHEWPSAPSLAAGGRGSVAQPVIYELHVKGFGGDFHGIAGHLAGLADLGVDVIELMPVHPFDDADNYWGYMPLVWGAVHEGYGGAAGLAALCAAAHEQHIEVWLDVVFNHTGEGDASLPTRSFRGLSDARSYRRGPDGMPTDESGCGNDINPADPEIRRLVVEALDRFAGLGVDGFRFDLASLLTHDDGGMVAAITAWAAQRSVRLIAEPWDLASYQVGDPLWPAAWLQWNDRFRDDVRGFVRGEPGMVPAMMQRLGGSADLFGERPTPTINFITAHDGLTMHDLTIVDSDRHRSWDCGPELRDQQLRNYFTLLLLADGAAMFVMGDECGRTQGGHDNPYNIDSELTWMDWGRAAEWDSLRGFVRSLIGLRRRSSRAVLHFHGVDMEPDGAWESRSLAWETDDLYVMVNMWWEPLTFAVHAPGEWGEALRTAPGTGLTVAPRSILVLTKT